MAFGIKIQVNKISEMVEAELKKVADLANHVGGTLWESGEHFDQIFWNMSQFTHFHYHFLAEYDKTNKKSRP